MTCSFLLAFRIETRSPMCALPSTHQASGCGSSCPTCARPSVTDELPHGTDLGGLLDSLGIGQTWADPWPRSGLSTSPNPSETELSRSPRIVEASRCGGSGVDSMASAWLAAIWHARSASVCPEATSAPLVLRAYALRGAPSRPTEIVIPQVRRGPE